jgi:predicted metalloprotease with PDZ domain
MKRLVFVLLIALTTVMAMAQASLHYDFAAPNATHHEAEISLTVDGINKKQVAIFRMSRSSPGRYATHEFGKNVYNVKAFDKAGNALQIEKIDADVYQVSGHKGYVKLSYTLYGNHADGTYASIDATGYHLNMPASFMWLKGYEQTPISISFQFNNPDFKIATQLPPQAGSVNTFTAPDLAYFMDSPTKVGKLMFREWTVKNPDGKSYTIRFALEAESVDSVVDKFFLKLKDIVAEATAVFGETPAFDYGTYTFIASINPYVKGDGMEHRNSTMICLPLPFAGQDFLLDVFAHEFFHSWNVERIRPKSIEPFNYEKSNMSEGLWLAEGFTQYYGDFILHRAGILSLEEWSRSMEGLIAVKSQTPGGIFYSPIENSQRAVFADAGVSVDKTNYPNMYSSYYPYGGAIALALELDLRSRFNLGLDAYMQQLWTKHGKSEQPYTMTDLQQALADLTGNESYAQVFFAKYIYGYEPFDYAAVLRKAGLVFAKANSGKAWMGNLSFKPQNNELVMANNSIRNTPMYEAGIDIDDVLVSLNGRKIKEFKDIDETLAAHKPGDTLKVVYRHRGKIMDSIMVLQENPAMRITIKSEGDLTDSERLFRKEWLSTKIKY